MYKKVQKNIFLHFLKILKCYSIELLALSPNPLSDLWGRIPKKSYRARNIDKKFKKMLPRDTMFVPIKRVLANISIELFSGSNGDSTTLLESIVKSNMGCSHPEIYGHEQG